MKAVILIFALLLSGCSSFNGFVAGENGLAHGAITGAAAGATYYSTGSKRTARNVACGVAGFYFLREAHARDTFDMSEWNTDSQRDALVPAAVCGIAWLLSNN